MITLPVDLGPRSYPIHVGSGLIADPEPLAPHVAGRQALVVTNETVAPLYREPLLGALRAAGAAETATLALPDGERHKTLDTLSVIVECLVDRHFGRDCVVLALGGGVVGDVAGFAAACYQRGVRMVQVPTTLLAQVDSSVGGKTAVNHPRAKNMIGAFHQPSAVLADIDTLDTLPDRELRAGFAEVVKYGLIRDADFFARLERDHERILGRDAEALADAVCRSCQSKARIVAEDERESGVRALLNLGHTFGHAIEAGVGYGEWLHGEAVAAGICLAADLSVRIGWLADADADRVRRLLGAAGLPVRAPASMAPARMLELMAADKKVRARRLRLVLLREIGRAELTDAFDQRALDATLASCRSAA